MLIPRAIIRSRAHATIFPPGLVVDCRWCASVPMMRLHSPFRRAVARARRPAAHVYRRRLFCGLTPRSSCLVERCHRLMREL